MIPIKHKGNDIFLVNDDVILNICVSELSQHMWFAFDTEFETIERDKYKNRELCLIQIAIPGKIYLIDILSKINLTKLFSFFENEKILKIVHSPSEDIYLLQQRRCYPQNIFDTQKAATFLGFDSNQIGFGDLLNRVLNIKIDKGEQRSKWKNRPLTISQIKYAANDVIYLHDIKKKLHKLMEEQNLLGYFEKECFYECNYYRKIKANIDAYDKIENVENDNLRINELKKIRIPIQERYNEVFAKYILKTGTIKQLIEESKILVISKEHKELIEKSALKENVDISKYNIEVVKYSKEMKGVYNKPRIDKKINYKGIEKSFSGDYFMKNGKRIFKVFKEVLSFHEPGLAVVLDETGWYHINAKGKAMYKKRYARAFGYYNGRASVIENGSWHHIKTKGQRLNEENYAWCGNYQEKLCVVRDFEGNYFHIDIEGKRTYPENYSYAGDFKDGYAAVRLKTGLYKHIDYQGKDLNGKLFKDLGVFHKNFATAKDENGWFHIDKKGNELYSQRYAMIEPFYNGFSLVEKFSGKKLIIDEIGENTILFD